MFTSEYDLAFDDEPDCEDCGRQLKWQTCKHCGGVTGYRDWQHKQPVRCHHCEYGGQYVCPKCDKSPKVENGQLGLFEVTP